MTVLSILYAITAAEEEAEKANEYYKKGLITKAEKETLIKEAYTKVATDTTEAEILHIINNCVK